MAPILGFIWSLRFLWPHPPSQQMAHPQRMGSWSKLHASLGARTFGLLLRDLDSIAIIQKPYYLLYIQIMAT